MVPSVPMPAELLAAAREARDVLAVRLDLEGASVVAVIGGEGDPRQWWTAIWRVAGPDASVPLSVGPRLQALPAGLSALAIHHGAGEPALWVSDSIEPQRQRAAVQVALGASQDADGGSRRRARRDAVLARFGALGQPGRIRAAVALTALVLVAASVAIAVPLGRPQQERFAARPAQNQAGRQSGAGPAAATGGNGPVGGVSGGPGTTSHPGTPGASASPTPRGRGHSTSRPSPDPTGSRAPSPSPSASGPPTSPASPTPTSPVSSSQPSPSPVPSASPSSGNCVVILGIQVCV